MRSLKDTSFCVNVLILIIDYDKLFRTDEVILICCGLNG